jgi:hypothetical protein
MRPSHFDLDLATPQPRPAAWGLAVLLVGALLAAFAADRWLDAHVQRDEARAALVRLQQAQQRQARVPAARAAADRAAAADARVRADLARIAADLHRPWWALLDAVERPLGPSVQVMQIGVDAGFTRLQLQVQARTLPDVLRLVQALDGAAPPLRGAQLVGHEWVGGESAVAGAAVPRQVVARLVVQLGAGPAP